MVKGVCECVCEHARVYVRVRTCVQDEEGKLREMIIILFFF